MSESENVKEEINNEEKEEDTYGENLYYKKATECLKKLPFGKIPPALIDFKGESLYLCNTRPKAQELTEVLKRIEHDGYYISTEVRSYKELHEDIKDLEHFLDVASFTNQRFMKKFLILWHRITKDERLRTMKKAFSIWRITRNFNKFIEKRERTIKEDVLRAIYAYRMHKRIKTSINKQKKKSVFNKWRDEKKESQKRNKVSRIDNRNRMHLTFTKMKAITNKRKANKSIKEKKSTINILKVKMFIDKWKESMIWNQHKKEMQRNATIKTFDNWRLALQKRQEQHKQEVKDQKLLAKYEEKNGKRIKAQYFSRIHNKFIYKANKRKEKQSRRIMRNWETIYKNLMNYYYCRVKLIQLSEEAFFKRIRTIHYRQYILFISNFFSFWYEYTDSMKKYKALAEERRKTTLYKAMGKWYLRWRYVDDMKKIVMFRQKVSYKNKKIKYFYTWRIRTQEKQNDKVRKYVGFRIIKLETKAFNTLRTYALIKINHRKTKEDNENRRILSIAFNAMHEPVEEKNEKAQKLYEYNLKKRMLSNFVQLLQNRASLIDSRAYSLRAQVVDDSHEIIEMLNAEKPITEVDVF